MGGKYTFHVLNILNCEVRKKSACFIMEKSKWYREESITGDSEWKLKHFVNTYRAHHIVGTVLYLVFYCTFKSLTITVFA